jgi:hypothetical protein
MSRQHDTESKSQVDPSLLAASGDAASEFPIDPALYAIEEVVDDVRKGKIRLQEQSVQGEGGEPVKQDGVHGVPSLAMGASGDHHGTGQGMQIEDDGIDPALREIVNSLTNAQQVCSIIAFIQAQTDVLSSSPLKASVPASLTLKWQLSSARTSPTRKNANDSSKVCSQPLKISLRLASVGSHPYYSLDPAHPHSSVGSLFPPNFPHSPTNQTYLLSPDNAEAGPSTISPSGEGTNDPPSLLGKRGRGRPKGSKNKPKPGQPTPPPQPSPPPKRPKGRPPKVRTEEEQVEYDRRKTEKAMGLKRQKGRPRKFPGYLVREMRLKKNRSEFNELLRSDEEGRDDSAVRESSGEGIKPEGYQGWAGDDAQSLLDVVGTARIAGEEAQLG